MPSKALMDYKDRIQHAIGCARDDADRLSAEADKAFVAETGRTTTDDEAHFAVHGLMTSTCRVCCGSLSIGGGS